jgi:hypothetical protein
MALQQDAITNPGNAAIDAEKERELNVAAWTLFISHPPADINAFTNAINNSHYGTAVYNYLQGANAAVAGGYTAAHWYAVTPDPQTGNNALQEFLTYIPPNGHIVPTVPEPAALVLLGTIVGILSLKTYRRKQRA